MKNSLPSARAIRSALVGLAAGALVIGTVAYGGTFAAALRGDDLQASQAARTAFVVPATGTASALHVPRGTRTPTTQTTTQIAYRVAELRSVDGESQED